MNNATKTIKGKATKYYVDITEEWLHNSDTSVKEIGYAKYVIKNGKRYYVNKRNKIEHKNREVENARWYVNLMGGKIQFYHVSMKVIK